MSDSHGNSSDAREVVFVLGAGASRDFGIPLMREFGNAILSLDQRFRLSRHGCVLDDFRRVARLLRDNKPCGPVWFEPHNIEHLLCLLSMKQEIGEPEAAQNLASLTNTIAHCVEKRHAGSQGNAGDGIPPLSQRGYVQLLRMLLHEYKKPWLERQRAPFAFVTLNYDLALEHAWKWTVEQNVAPWLTAILREQWYEDYDVTITDDQRRRVRAILEENGAVPGLPLAHYGLLNRPTGRLRGYPPFLKLHGSINWGVCPVCGNVAEVAPKWRAGGPRVIDDLQGEICRWHPASQWPGVEHCSVPPRQPLLVPPTWSKSSMNETVRDIWRQAAIALRWAKKLVFIGYSFPDSDMHIRYLFGVSSEQPSCQHTLVVNDHGDDQAQEQRTRQRYENALGVVFDSNANHYHNGKLSVSIDCIREFIA